MEQLVVVGGWPIHGEMMPAGNKNEALPCLAAALSRRRRSESRTCPRSLTRAR